MTASEDLLARSFLDGLERLIAVYAKNYHPDVQVYIDFEDRSKFLSIRVRATSSVRVLPVQKTVNGKRVKRAKR